MLHPYLAHAFAIDTQNAAVQPFDHADGIGVRYLLIRSGRVTTFAQMLFGSETFTEPGFEEMGFAMQPGGGLDYRVWAGAGLRIQGDFRLSRQGDATVKDWRRFVGGVYRIN